jgi:hypothetical protein
MEINRWEKKFLKDFKCFLDLVKVSPAIKLTQIKQNEN